MPHHSTKNGHPVWTPEEDAFITDNFRKLTIKEMAAHLGRTPSAVRNRRLLIGVSGTWKFQWTPEKEQRVRDAYRSRTIRDSVGQDALAKELGCTLISLQRKASQLGLVGSWGTLRDENGRFPCQQPKYETDEERRAALSEKRQRMWIDRPHPRGALGMKHTPEAKRAMAEATRRYFANATPEQLYEKGRKAAMTKVKRYGTAGPVNVENPYTRTKGGKRADLGDMYFRSAWEANYARYLNWLLENKDIQAWEYEADTFIFEGYTRGAMTYRPDFKITENDGRVVYHEIKGWMDGPSKTRLKRMAKHYPEVEVVVIGEAEYKALRKWASLIPNWE